MSVWLRLFTFNKMKEYYDKQSQENEKIQNQLKNKSNQSIIKPNISQQPTYIAKAPKK